MSDALHWLVKFNPLYNNIKIDYERIKQLPENANLEGMPELNFTEDERECKGEDDDDDSGHIGIDRVPVSNQAADEAVYHKNKEMSSFLPVNLNSKKEHHLLTDEFADKWSDRHERKTNEIPLSESKTDSLASMTFPTLFPDGKADPTNNATLCNMSENETEAFAQKVKYLIKFGKKINYQWVYRFSAHPGYAY